MTNDNRDLLEVLKAELEFLEKGGYRHTARAQWRPQFIFQDSPTCLNFDSTRPSRPCSDCILLQLVPEDSRSWKIPCRYIPLTEQGETIDSLYQTGTQEELEAAVRRWLRTTIPRLEREKAEGLKASDSPEVHVRARFVTGR
jgi:hypothetical protein